jgi:hypothetical protein
MNETITIDLDDYPKEVLYFLIKQSCEEDVSVNKVIENCISKFLFEVRDNPNQLLFDF